MQALVNGREFVASMNPKLEFVVFGSFYFSVLLVSYLLALFYPFFVPYGWFVIPVVANFFVGYLVREVSTALKIIFAYFFLQTIIVIGLLNVPSVYDAFLSMKTHSWPAFRWGEAPFSAWIIGIISIYWILHIPVGITVSYVGTFVRDYGRDIIKHISKRNIYRLFFWLSCAALIACCWILWLLFLVGFSRMRYATTSEIWSRLSFLLGFATIILTWFLIKYLKRIFTQ